MFQPIFCTFIPIKSKNLAPISTNSMIYTVFARLNTSLLGLLSSISSFVVFPHIFSFNTLKCLVTYLRSNFCQNTNIRKIKASSNELNKVIMTCFFHFDNFKSKVFTFHSEGITVKFLRKKKK